MFISPAVKHFPRGGVSVQFFCGEGVFLQNLPAQQVGQGFDHVKRNAQGIAQKGEGVAFGIDR